MISIRPHSKTIAAAISQIGSQEFSAKPGTPKLILAQKPTGFRAEELKEVVFNEEAVYMEPSEFTG
jgi:hypothetical protein